MSPPLSNLPHTLCRSHCGTSSAGPRVLGHPPFTPPLFCSPPVAHLLSFSPVTPSPCCLLSLATLPAFFLHSRCGALKVLYGRVPLGPTPPLWPPPHPFFTPVGLPPPPINSTVPSGLPCTTSSFLLAPPPRLCPLPTMCPRGTFLGGPFLSRAGCWLLDFVSTRSRFLWGPFACLCVFCGVTFPGLPLVNWLWAS